MQDWWKAVAPFVRVERYHNRKGVQARVEVAKEYANSASLLKLVGDCSGCNSPFAPVKQRQGFSPYPYIRVTCGGDRCVRSEQARITYKDLLEYLRTGTETYRPMQGRLL